MRSTVAEVEPTAMVNGEELPRKSSGGEQFLGRFFEGQADADTAGTEPSPDHHLHSQALQQHQVPMAHTTVLSSGSRLWMSC